MEQDYRPGELASIWTRMAALVVDSLLSTLFFIPIYMLLLKTYFFETLDFDMFEDTLVFWLCAIPALAGLVFLFWNLIYRVGVTGQSLGRKYLGIAVLDRYGHPIGVGRAFGREMFGRLVSAMICNLGYLWGFWDKHSQMWHDKIASCFVYYVEEDFS